jgi:hypothetical protein
LPAEVETGDGITEIALTCRSRGGFEGLGQFI